jgi:hypothetical protein
MTLDDKICFTKCNDQCTYWLSKDDLKYTELGKVKYLNILLYYNAQPNVRLGNKHSRVPVSLTALRAQVRIHCSYI